MLQCPILHYENNLIFDAHSDCWAVYKLKGFIYENRSTEKKHEILYNLAQAISSVVSQASFLMIPSIIDIPTHFENLQRTLKEDDPLADFAKKHAMLTKEYLMRKYAAQKANQYDTYFIVKLCDNSDFAFEEKLKDGISYFIKNPMAAIDTFMGTAPGNILSSKLKSFTKLSNEFFKENNSRISMMAATPGEIQFILKRSTMKGNEKNIQLFQTRKIVIEDGIEKTILSDWTPFAQRVKTYDGSGEIIRPHRQDIVKLFSGSIKNKGRNLEIQYPDGTKSYQTYLVFSHIPEITEFPGNEWIYALQNLNVQAEICIHFTVVDVQTAESEIEKKQREIESQYVNIKEAKGPVPKELSAAAAETMELTSVIKQSRSPVIRTCVSVCLFGSSIEQLDTNANTVITYFKDLKYYMERPLTDQFKFFLQHIPGAGQYVMDYNMVLLPIVLAGGVIGATNKLGDDVGPYCGITSNKTPVYLDLGQACLANMSASMTEYGDLGVGKSYAGNILSVWNVIYGGYSLIFDPKAERGHWAEELPWLTKEMNIVTLKGDDENIGRLDPFIIYKDNFPEASALAFDVICELCGISANSDEDIVLKEAIEKLKTEEKPCMLKLCRQLDAFPEDDALKTNATRLARRLRNIRTTGLTMLLFGCGEEQAITLDKRLNILQINNLQLPKATVAKKDYSSEERISTVIMMVLGNFAKKFALMPRDVFSLVLFDESWMLSRTDAGRKLFDFLARMGRSLYTGCIFNGHSVLDNDDEGLKNTITFKACYRTKSTDEAYRMLDYMGMEKTDDNVKLLKSLENGECLFKDMYDRISVMKFDAVFKEIDRVFDTNPAVRLLASKEEISV